MYHKYYMKDYLDNAPKIVLRLSNPRFKYNFDEEQRQILDMLKLLYRIDSSSFFGCLDSGLLT